MSLCRQKGSSRTRTSASRPKPASCPIDAFGGKTAAVKARNTGSKSGRILTIHRGRKLTAEPNARPATFVTANSTLEVKNKVRQPHMASARCTHSRCNRQGHVMAERDAWEKAESISKIFAAVLIPVVLGIASLYANQALEKSKTRDASARAWT